MAAKDADICPNNKRTFLKGQQHICIKANWRGEDAPSNDAELSPFLSRSKSACIEFVWRTPEV
jgi:hypothetical protein